MDTEKKISDPIAEYQAEMKERQELLGYCKKISQGIDNLDEKSGERAIWELIQNARDRDANCKIRIELKQDSIVFAHHGEPFDYLSLLALVNQNSSKDNPGADLVGQYGTGFMTTHAFNDIVSVDGPYKIMESKDLLKGYVKLDGFELNRSYKNDIKKAINEMRKEMQQVHEMYKRTPIYEDLDEWTSFTYKLTSEQVVAVSEQLSSAIRLMPMVLVINERIKEVEVNDCHSKRHFKIQKSAERSTSELRENRNWQIITDTIDTINLDANISTPDTVISLQSKNNEDIILLPPYPDTCGDVSSIPSLFMCFPLLGTEHFGVNFVFHSKRFHPVEKRNNILLPENVPSKLEKGRHNENVLKEMMRGLFDYLAISDNDTALTREMCEVNFKSEKDDEITTKFYADLQDMWKVEAPKWKIIPTNEGRKSMDDAQVRVLHPDFYSKLTREKRKEYESTLTSYAQLVKDADEQSYLMPIDNLIAWSETVYQWSCNRDNEFFITIEDVCNAIKSKTDNLYHFLMFLKESGNESLFDKYPLLPSRNGNLHLKKDLRHGDFMTSELYALASPLMGKEVEKIFDTSYAEICTVGAYSVNDLRSAIRNTIDEWRKASLSAKNKAEPTEQQISIMATFCSAFSVPTPTSFRFRMMKQITAIRGITFSQTSMAKQTDEEEDFYEPTFNLLLDSTLYYISLKKEEWVKANKQKLFDFVREFATSEKKERVARLDEYGIIPCQKGFLCIKKELRKNAGVPPEMAEIYNEVKNENLYKKWVDVDFETLFTFESDNPVAIATIIQNEMKEELKLPRPNKYRNTLKKIILLLNEDAKWQDWFDVIDAQKQTITFKMQSGPAQKSLFSLMDMTDSELAELAKIKEEGNMEDMLSSYRKQQELERNNAARFHHLYSIGKRIEDVLREKIGEGNVKVEQRQSKEDKLVADDIQNGQDIVVKLLINDEWKEIYYIEVKSKWDFNEPAHMSTRQVRMASLHRYEYSLCCVDLREHKNEDLASLPVETILACTKVKMNIGSDLYPMMIGILEADKRPDENQIKISEYRSNMSAKVFEVGAPFQELLDRIETIAKKTLKI